MLKVTVKTLDSQNHTFSVNDDILVKDFKDEINTKLQIPSELQKLIFCGRVLQDEKRLSEYEVNEKVVHLVKKQPQLPGSIAPPPPDQNANNGNETDGRRTGQGEPSFTIQGPGSLTGLVHSLLGHIDDAMRTATTSPAGQNREGGEGSERHVNIHINLNDNEPRDSVDTRLNSIRRLLGYIGASLNELDRIPNSTMAANVSVGAGGSGASIGTTSGNATGATGRSTGENGRGNASQVTIQTGSNGNGSFDSLLENIILNSTAALARNFNLDVGSVQIQGVGSNVLPTASAASTTPNIVTAQPSTPNNSTSSTATLNTANIQASTANNATNRPSSFERMRQLLEETQRTQQRLDRHLSRMTGTMQPDAQTSQEDLTTLQSDHRLISRAMHHLAHVYHLLSDLQINFAQRERNQVGLFTQAGGSSRVASNRGARRNAPQMRSMSETRRPRQQSQRTPGSTPSAATTVPSATLGSASTFASTTNLNTAPTNSISSNTASGLAASLRNGLAGSLILSQAPIVVMARPTSSLAGSFNLLNAAAQANQQSTRTTSNNSAPGNNTTNGSSTQNAPTFQPNNNTNAQHQPNVASNPSTNTQQPQQSQQQAPNDSHSARASAPFSFVSLESAHTSSTSIGHILDPFLRCNSVWCYPEIRSEVVDISLIAVPDFGFGNARPNQPPRQAANTSATGANNPRPTDVNFIRDLYSIVLQHIPQNELISLLITRDFTPLNRVRDQLNNYVRNVMFAGQEPTSEQIDRRVRSMADSLQTQVNLVFNSPSDQQVGGQLISFINTNLHRLIQLLLNPPQVGEFARSLQQLLTDVWNEYLQRIWPLLTNRLHLVTRTLEQVTASMQDPFLNSVMGLLSRGISAQTSQPAQTSSSSDAQSFASSATDADSSNRDNLMEVDSEPLPQPQPSLSNFAAFANGLTANLQSLFPVFSQSSSSTASSSSAPPISTNNPTGVHSSNSSFTRAAPSPGCPSSDWRSNVPTSWLPIMQTDARLLQQDRNRLPVSPPNTSRELSAAYRSMGRDSNSPSDSNS